MADIKNHSTLTTGLVSYWDLEETSGTRYDLHGANNLTDDSSVGSATGKIGNGADFESSSSDTLSKIDGVGGLKITGNLSIAFWFKSESDTIAGGLVSKYHETSDERSYTIHQDSGGAGKISFRISSDGTSGNTKILTSTSALTNGVFYHIVCVFTANTRMEIFINGSSDASDTTSIPASIYNSVADFYLGRTHLSANVRYVDGVVDEVGIWSKALTSDEITDLYNGGSGLPYYDPTNISGDTTLQTSLVSYYKLDETSGTRNDSKGTNHLTDTNTVLYGAGKLSNSADFEATNSEYLTITDASQSGLDMTGNMSFSAWINYESLPSAGTDRPIISKWNGGGWMLYTRISASVHYISLGVNSAVNVSVAWTPSTATWYHIVATYTQSSGATNIYLNGVLLGTGTASTTNPNNAHNFSIGMYESGASVFDGLIDEVAVHSKALSIGEVRALYGYGTPPEYDTISSGPANLKSLDTNLKANIKSINTNLIANVKSLDTNV